MFSFSSPSLCPSFLRSNVFTEHQWQSGEQSCARSTGLGVLKDLAQEFTSKKMTLPTCQRAWVLLSFPMSHQEGIQEKRTWGWCFLGKPGHLLPPPNKTFPLPALEVLKEVQTPLPASEVGASQALAPDQVSLAMVHLQTSCY